MATSNFGITDARAYFTVDFDNEDEFQAMHDYEHHEDVVREAIAKEFGEENVGDIKEYSGNKFYTNGIAIYRPTVHGDIITSIRLGLMAGYYSGANWDYEIVEHELDNPGIDISEFADSYIEEIEEEYKDRIEKVLREHTTTLRRVGSFSNGSTVYEAE